MAQYTLRQLEYFVAVAEAGSVTGAASRVHLSQSAMSTALADLERALDVQLLVRHHARGVTLTPAGEQLLVASRRLLTQAADLQAEAQDLGSALTGPLILGCFGVLAPYVLPELLATSAQRYPGLRLETFEEDLDDLADGVLSGRFELGLSYNLAQDPRLTSSLASRWPCSTSRRAATTSAACSSARASARPCATGRAASRPAVPWWGAAWPIPC